jgi:hypothetical protein
MIQRRLVQGASAHRSLWIDVTLAYVGAAENSFGTERVNRNHSQRLEASQPGGRPRVRIQAGHEKLEAFLHRFRCLCDRFSPEHAQQPEGVPIRPRPFQR